MADSESKDPRGVRRALEAALDRGALGLLEDVPRTTASEDLSGRVILGHRVIERISSGGMGDVWLAEREFGASRRRVAIKVLKRGLDTDALLARFHQESETLAALHHEHIVAFLDAGALPDGRPFLVMEYVDGLPIGRYCADRALGLRARLELFLDVSAAVHFAHGNLVLHRDLKPANILVTTRGTLKLLDFGVAKILEREGEVGDATDPRHAPTPVTPRYASPEQLTGQRVSAATDVYGLGLVLYELLAGRPAFPERTLATGGEAVEPPPPSAVCEGEPGARRSLRGDLDAIVLRAVQPDGHARYPSVEAFATDVRRYLAGEPVSARHGGLVDRSAKFARRNRWAVLAAGVLLACLATGLVGTWLGKRRAERDAGRGWGAHAQVLGAVAFLERLLVEGLPDDPVLDQRLSSIDEWPETEALVRLALARVELERDNPHAACTHLERSQFLAREERALGLRDQAHTLLLLGTARARTQDPRAAATLREAVVLFESLLRPDEEGLAACRAALAAFEPE